MSKLISGKEALIALANGKEVEYWCESYPSIQKRWTPLKALNEYKLSYLLEDNPLFKFRLKPRTITINGIELAPCYAVGIDHTKNEVSIQFHNNEDAVKLNNLLLNIYGFRNA